LKTSSSEYTAGLLAAIANREGLDESRKRAEASGVATEKLTIPSLAAVKDYIGMPLGPSEWVTITQERIDAFAHATGDRQWIHCDVERASRESPWKTTIAHGYLTLALTPDLLAQILAIIGWRAAVNTGLDKLRFSSPVPSGSRVRLSASIKDTRDLARNGLRVTFAVRIDVEGSSKPALLANVNYAYFPE